MALIMRFSPSGKTPFSTPTVKHCFFRKESPEGWVIHAFARCFQRKRKFRESTRFCTIGREAFSDQLLCRTTGRHCSTERFVRRDLHVWPGQAPERGHSPGNMRPAERTDDFLPVGRFGTRFRFRAQGLRVTLGKQPHLSLCNEAYGHMLQKFHGRAVFFHVPSSRYITNELIEKVSRALCESTTAAHSSDWYQFSSKP